MNARRSVYLFLTGAATAKPVSEFQPADILVALLGGRAHIELFFLTLITYRRSKTFSAQHQSCQ